MSKIDHKRVRRNIGFNFFGALVPLLVTLFTVPIYLHQIGSARYGVVLVAWSLLGYLGFMDLGISRATTNALSKIAHEDLHQVKHRIFWSSFLLNGALGTIGGLALYLGGSLLFRDVMKIDPGVQGEALAAMPYIAAMLPLALMLGVGVGTAEAHERFGTLNIIQMTGLVLGQAAPLLAVMYWGPALTLIMPVMLIVRGLTFVAVMSFAMYTAKIPLRPLLDIKVIKSLLSFGGWVTLTNLVSPIMTGIDQFVIGAVRSVATIPFYAVPLNIISRTQIIPTTLTRTLFPIFSRISHSDGDELVGDTLAHLSTVMTLVYMIGIFLSGPFLGLWLGAEMQTRGTPVLQLLCLGAWANSLAFVLFSALQGRGKPRAVATIHSCEVLPYLGVMWMLVHAYGILGAAIAWTLRVIVDAIALAWVARLDGTSLRATAPGAVCLVVAFLVAQNTSYGIAANIFATIAICAGFLGLNLVFNRPFATLLRSLWERRNGALV